MIPLTGQSVVCHATIFWQRGRQQGIEESVYGARSTRSRVST